MSLTIRLPKEMDRYLKFLEKTRFIKDRHQAILTSLEFFKSFGMHDWLPYIYRVGGFRVALVDTSFLNETFQLLSDNELFALGRKLGLRKKDENSVYDELDMRLVKNWLIVLRDLETLGWGKFELFGNEIKVESCCMPISFILGFLEGIFNTPFKSYFTKIQGITILMPTWKTR